MIAVRHRLRYVLRYENYVIYQGDDGEFIGEPQRGEDDFQIVSRDIVELCRAFDLIEDVVALQAVDKPDWLERHLADPTETVILPSAIPMTARPAVVEAVAAEKRFSDRVYLSHMCSEDQVKEALISNMLWTLMPTEIQRRFDPDLLRARGLGAYTDLGY